MNLNRRRLSVWLYAASALAMSQAPAHAETANADSASKPAVDEVVVTARQRQENLQQVPLAITALGATQLERSGVQSIRDLSYLTPGLTVNNGGGGSEADVQIVIRGQTNLNLGAGDPNVAVFIDGVYQQNTSAINMAFVGLDRIEVIKGPVSALYGRNAFAGVINYVTKRPGDTLAGEVTGRVGNDGMAQVNASIRGPVIRDLLSLGGSVSYDTFDGSWKDKVNGARAGGRDKRDVFVSGVFTPTSTLNVFGSWYYGDDHFDVPALFTVDNNCGLIDTYAAPSVFGKPVQLCGVARLTDANLQVPVGNSRAGITGNQRQVNNGVLRATWDVLGGQATAITGYNDVHQYRYTSASGLRRGLEFRLSPGPGTAFADYNIGASADVENFSQEIRFGSDQKQRFRYALGGFYFTGTRDYRLDLGIDRSDIPAGQTILPASAIALTYLSSDGQPATSNTVHQTDKQASGFAGADFDFTSALTLSGELRYTREKKTNDTLYNLGNPVYRPLGAPLGETYTFWNYRGTLKYAFTPNVNGYASIANGTKGGGFNAAAVLPAEQAFDPEKNTTYEVGLKSALFDRRLRLNAAAYYIDTTGLQVSVPTALAGSGSLVTQNLGSTHSIGVETEAVARVDDHLTLNLGVSYTRARFVEGSYDFGSGPLCLSVPGYCDASRVVSVQRNGRTATALSLDGLKVPRQSAWQVSAGADYRRPLNDSWEWFAHGDYRYESPQKNAVTNINGIDDRNIVNLRAGVSNKTLTATLFVDNATNNDTPEYSTRASLPNDGQGTWVVYMAPARTYGAQLTYKF